MDSKINNQIIAVSFGKILAMLTSFIVPVVLVRFLSKSDYGIYNQFNVVYLFVAAIFSLGFRSNMYFFYPTVPADKKSKILFNTTIVLLVLGVVAGLFIISGMLNDLIIDGNILSDYLYLIALTVFFHLFSQIIEPLYILRKDLKISLYYPFANMFLKAIFVLLMVFLFNSLKSSLYGVVLYLGLVFVFSVFYVFYEIKDLNQAYSFDYKIFLLQLKYSLPFGFSNSLKTVITKIDKIIAIGFLSTTAYASYSIAFLSIPGVQAIYDSLVQVYIVEMVKAIKGEDKKEVVKIYHDLVSKSFSYTLPVVILVFYYADFLIPFLFTQEFKDAVILFRIFVISTLFMVLGSGLVIRADGQTKETLKAYVISAVISLPLTYVLISKYAEYGAVLSALISTILPSFFLLKTDMKILKIGFRYFFPIKNILKIMLVSIVCFVPVLLIDAYLDYGWVMVVCNSLCYMLVVSYVLYRNNLFVLDKSFVNKSIKKIKRPKSERKEDS